MVDAWTVIGVGVGDGETVRTETVDGGDGDAIRDGDGGKGADVDLAVCETAEVAGGAPDRLDWPGFAQAAQMTQATASRLSSRRTIEMARTIPMPLCGMDVPGAAAMAAGGGRRKRTRGAPWWIAVPRLAVDRAEALHAAC